VEAQYITLANASASAGGGLLFQTVTFFDSNTTKYQEGCFRAQLDGTTLWLS
jgi:hypothetical protein